MRAPLLLLLLTACSGCASVSTNGNTRTMLTVAVTADFVILRDSLPPEKGAVTLCSWNNQPFVVVDYATVGRVDDEALIVHEATHVAQMRAFKGGCWPFLYRYASDSAFKAQAEFEAYCAEGRWLMTRNRHPATIWAHIANTMLFRYGLTLTAGDNCLFEERTG